MHSQARVAIAAVAGLCTRGGGGGKDQGLKYTVKSARWMMMMMQAATPKTKVNENCIKCLAVAMANTRVPAH